MAELTVGVLLPYEPGTTPSQRFRLEQWAPHLLARGIRLEFAAFADDSLMETLYSPGRYTAKAWGLLTAFARRAIALATSRDYDALVIHRSAALFGPVLLEHLARRRAPVVYDFDDSIFLVHTTTANRMFGWLKFAGKTAAICRLSDHVVVGNAYLADYARRYNPRVTVVPTSIDTDSYVPRARTAAGTPVVVGWTGSATSQTYLEMFAPMLRDLAARRAVEIRVISNRQPRLDEVPHVWEPWDAARESEAIAAFDVGIMPMPDDPWARGKCALKALQCMALEVATVASAVGANCEVIDHDRNGLLVRSAADWPAHILGLVDDPSRRARLGREARRTVLERYSARGSAGRLAEVILDTVARARRGPGRDLVEEGR